jgi:hypothetical protein
MKLSASILICLLTIGSVSSVHSQVPSNTISDSDFWRMIRDYSEADGQFPYENFVSNEVNYQSVIPKLSEAVKPGGIYLGVGPDQNFAYVLALKPSVAFIIDIRRQNLLELLMYKALFDLAPERPDFVARLFARRRPSGLDRDSTTEALFAALGRVTVDPEYATETLNAILANLKGHGFQPQFGDETGIRKVYRAFVDGGPVLAWGSGWTPTYADLMSKTDGEGKNRGYLATEENYRALQELERANRIVPLVGDFAGPKAIGAAGQFARDQQQIVTAFYLSNVEQYLFASGSWPDFYANVATLPLDSSSVFIRAVYKEKDCDAPVHRMIAGSDFLTELQPMMDVTRRYRANQLMDYCDTVGNAR